MRPTDLNRRHALLHLALLPGCGIASSAEGEDAIALPLAHYPELIEPGSSAVVSLPAALLELVVLHRRDGTFCALWNICPHGACSVEYEADRRQLVCPCHGSRFDETGTVLLGPARKPLRYFAVSRVADTLYIHRDSGRSA